MEKVSLVSCAWRCDQHGKRRPNDRRPNVGAQAAKCRCTGRWDGDASTWHGAVHCLSTRCTVFRRPAQPAHLRKLASLAARRVGVRRLGHPRSLCTDIWNGRALLEGIWVSTRCPSGFLGRLFPGNSPGNSAPSSSPRRFPTPSTLNPNPSPPTFLFSHKHARTHCIALPLAYAAFPIPCCALTWLRSHF